MTEELKLKYHGREYNLPVYSYLSLAKQLYVWHSIVFDAERGLQEVIPKGKSLEDIFYNDYCTPIKYPKIEIEDRDFFMNDLSSVHDCFRIEARIKIELFVWLKEHQEEIIVRDAIQRIKCILGEEYVRSMLIALLGNVGREVFRYFQNVREGLYPLTSILRIANFENFEAEEKFDEKKREAFDQISKQIDRFLRMRYEKYKECLKIYRLLRMFSWLSLLGILACGFCLELNDVILWIILICSIGIYLWIYMLTDRPSIEKEYNSIENVINEVDGKMKKKIPPYCLEVISEDLGWDLMVRVYLYLMMYVALYRSESRHVQYVDAYIEEREQQLVEAILRYETKYPNKNVMVKKLIENYAYKF